MSGHGMQRQQARYERVERSAGWVAQVIWGLAFMIAVAFVALLVYVVAGWLA